MLSLYRRHRSKCPQANDRISRKCRCAIWATGTIEGKPFRQSLKTRNFERAEILKRKLEDGVTPREKGITIKDATDAFIKDCQARNLNTSTFGKYKRLCKRILSFGGPAPLEEWTWKSSGASGPDGHWRRVPPASSLSIYVRYSSFAWRMDG